MAYVAVGRTASTEGASTWAVAAPARTGTLPQVWNHVGLGGKLGCHVHSFPKSIQNERSAKRLDI